MRLRQLPVAVLPLGEAAYMIRLGDDATVENAERAAALAELIRSERLDGVTEVVPSVASVFVGSRELGVGSREWGVGSREWGVGSREWREKIESRLGELAEAVVGGPVSRVGGVTHSVPVVYDGPDLGEVAQLTGLTPEAVIARHCEPEYHVLALGFLPGWAYLGPLDDSLRLPRRDAPRTRIPAGSVAIAGGQTGIYPRVSPGGWHLIGSTSAVLFDAQRERPSLFRPGDRVRFVPVK